MRTRVGNFYFVFSLSARTVEAFGTFLRIIPFKCFFPYSALAGRSDRMLKLQAPL